MLFFSSENISALYFRLMFKSNDLSQFITRDTGKNQAISFYFVAWLDHKRSNPHPVLGFSIQIAF